MKFNSTRNPEVLVGLREAVFQGLAPDGGLYQPTEAPDLRPLFQGFTAQTSFVEVAARVFHGLFQDEYTFEESLALCTRAFPFSPEIKKVAEGMYVLELFHGPSCAFKDFGASFLATIMSDFLKKEQQRAVILTATSGDTGSAVAQAFYGKENIDVVILYPKGRVSPSQEMQLTTVGGNVHALEVLGAFDDCQRMVKEAFLDPTMRTQFPLTSANSISLGRLIPQSFYYAWAFAQLKGHHESGEVYFCVPSGNFGNLTAGVMAWSWGLPVSGFLAATNQNDVVPEYLNRGRYQPRPSVETISNAMDVGNPSNFERLQAIFSMDLQSMKSMIQGYVVDDKQTKEVMARYLKDHDYSICPHTAVGLAAAETYKAELDGAGSIVTLATAHPGKFSEVVLDACGVKPVIPERLAEFMKREKKATTIGNTLEDLRGFLSRTLGR